MLSSMYIHIPFCRNICSYCNFTKIYYNQEISIKYLKALREEINEKYNNEEIKTLYIGGGTPSVLSSYELNVLFKILSTIKLANDNEFTIEVNVNDINEEKLELFKRNGINRLSVGVQTVNDNYLKLLERENDKQMVYENINLAKKYFNNISVDLMYGFHNQTIEELNEDIKFITSLNISHISIYSLIIEENTKLYINNVKPIDEEIESEMYYNIIRALESHGYYHYEISNFSKKGYESKHNLTYWNNDRYYGFGLSASGYIDNIRYTNTKNLNKYLENNYKYEIENLTMEDEISYYMILGLRKIKGINLEEFKNRFNLNLNDIFNIEKLITEEKLLVQHGYLKINRKYLYISNQILVEFIR